jgi:hypothetical protein
MGRHEQRNCRCRKCRPCARRWLAQNGAQGDDGGARSSSKAIELKKQGFGVAAAKDEAAKQPSRHEAPALAVARTSRSSATRSSADERPALRPDSVDAFGIEQFRHFFARVEHPRLDGILWGTDDFADLCDRLFVVVDEIDDLLMCRR